MLLSDLNIVRAAHIILASASPRRSAILNEQLGLNVRVVPSSFAEDLDQSAFASASLYCEATAREKALQVYDKCTPPFMSKHGHPPSLVVGADTVVVVDGQILEKPACMDGARAMLRQLSAAGTHTVCTAVSLIYGSTEAGVEPYEHTFSEETTVTFRALSDEEIETYVATGEPMDAAGSYAIQGLGGTLVSGISGDYLNVVGFPMSRFCSELDTNRLTTWIAAAVSNEVAAPSSTADDGNLVVNELLCKDEDECGMPSD